MRSRNSILELWRFIAALLIMATHMYNFGYDNYYFRETWMYVEMFLMISGFYIAKHYDRSVYDNKTKEAVLYTVNKYIPLIIYAAVPTIVAYVIYVYKAFLNVDYKRVVMSFGGALQICY